MQLLNLGYWECHNLKFCLGCSPIMEELLHCNSQALHHWFITAVPTFLLNKLREKLSSRVLGTVFPVFFPFLFTKRIVAFSKFLDLCLTRRLSLNLSQPGNQLSPDQFPMSISESLLQLLLALNQKQPFPLLQCTFIGWKIPEIFLTSKSLRFSHKRNMESLLSLGAFIFTALF